MNNLEYLLTSLMEECGELSQSISKCVRFTPNHVCPKKGKPNIEDVRIEFSDVMALLEMLRDEEGIDIQASRSLIEEKKLRFKKMRQISRELGTLAMPATLCLNGIVVELGDELVKTGETHFRVESVSDGEVSLWCTHGDWDATLTNDLKFTVHMPFGWEDKTEKTSAEDWVVNKAVLKPNNREQLEADFSDDTPF